MRRDNSRPPANLLWFVRSAYSLFCAHPYKSITSFIASLNLRPTLTHSTNSGFTDDNCTCQSTCPCKDARSCRTRCCYRIPPGLSDSSYEIMTASSQTASGSTDIRGVSASDAGKDGQGKPSSIRFTKMVTYRAEEHEKFEGECCVVM